MPLVLAFILGVAFGKAHDLRIYMARRAFKSAIVNYKSDRGGWAAYMDEPHAALAHLRALGADDEAQKSAR